LEVQEVLEDRVVLEALVLVALEVLGRVALEAALEVRVVLEEVRLGEVEVAHQAEEWAQEALEVPEALEVVQEALEDLVRAALEVAPLVEEVWDQEVLVDRGQEALEALGPTHHPHP